jgi:hypothetical protein
MIRAYRTGREQTPLGTETSYELSHRITLAPGRGVDILTLSDERTTPGRVTVRGRTEDEESVEIYTGWLFSDERPGDTRAYERILSEAFDQPVRVNPRDLND